ncbi:MAG: helicase-related protein [Calditrichaeota bacterium]|nr:helicase-related protein [Calditrichota bacterium]
METKITSGIRDNHKRGKIGDFLREKIKPGSKLSFVSAFFTIYAYHHLRKELNAIDELDFLFGEPKFLTPSSLDPEKSDQKAFKIEDEELQLSNRLQQKKVAVECAEWIRQKVNIRSVRKPNFLHGKLYHIDNDGVNEAIIGSSNFTVRGLGLNEQFNIELNLKVDSRRDLEDLYEWFQEIWNDETLVEDVKERVLHYLAQLYQENEPKFIYFKSLFHIFERFLDEQAKEGLLYERSLLTETDIWKTLFEFQKDGVKAAINKIMRHSGCIIADSVGLGKTYEALAIIKHFELLNYRVLVLCPKKLKDNWTIYQAHTANVLNPFPYDRFAYTVLSHSDLSREKGFSGDIDLSKFNWQNFDLVVIDESHNFRNNTKGKRDEEGNIIRKSRYERLMADILKAGVKTKVLMLSATPVNNTLADLRNQIYFVTEADDSAFAESMEVGSIHETLKNAQATFTRWADTRTGEERQTKDLLERLPSTFFKLLDELTIARSRKHIEHYYRAEMTRIGRFPERVKPVSLYPEIDLKKRFLSYDRLNDEISNYQLSLFNPSKYVKPEHRDVYIEKTKSKQVLSFTQEDREHFLIGMMKVNFLKRLESSVESFEITLERTIAKIDSLIAKIIKFQVRELDTPEIDFSELNIDELDDEELTDALQVGKKLTFNLAHLDVSSWLKDLEQDKKQLEKLWQAACEVAPDDDAKLKALKQLIEEKVKHPTKNSRGQDNRKVLVFTAFADTASYLYEQLRDLACSDLNVHIALVTGGTSGNKTTFGNTEFAHILTNFSPIAKQREKTPALPQEAEIDILIATDCISEGQNLQDCDTVINYDIHWNPVRIIQRFGRIDRIGSLNEKIQMVNFWPTKDLEKYINLKNRVEARMALVDITATGDEAILSNDQLRNLITDELNYREKQLLRLKDEVLDLEEFNETVTLSEFTLDDFRMDLIRYLEKNRQLLEKAPLGLYAVVPSPSGLHAKQGDYDRLDKTTRKIIAPGVIFCLKHKGDGSGTEQVNPLQPYYLVYIREDGVVRYSFTQPKQILEIYRLLCVECQEPYEALANLFNQETNNGDDMSKYTDSLHKAVKAIAGTFKRRNVANLLTDRGGRLVDAQRQIRDTSDFELITWLIIL